MNRNPHSAGTVIIALRVGGRFEYIPIHEIVANPGPEKSVVISYFYSPTGGYSVSFFARRGKNSAWLARQTYPDMCMCMRFCF